ncbi:hypothetical protein KDA23_02260 [Candidatus Saccharibacteria bacterium]|nr:hypothetical protein [Candidatus Saccharibacteria bacterium]
MAILLASILSSSFDGPWWVKVLVYVAVLGVRYMYLPSFSVMALTCGERMCWLDRGDKRIKTPPTTQT